MMFDLDDASTEHPTISCTEHPFMDDIVQCAVLCKLQNMPWPVSGSRFPSPVYGQLAVPGAPVVSWSLYPSVPLT